MRFFRWFAVALLGAALGGCQAKEEARSVVSAVDRYRKASNDDKPELADAIDKVPCTDAEVCAAKSACVKSANATAKGLRLQEEVQTAVKAGGKMDSDALAQKWKDASGDLDEGYARLEECTSKLEVLRGKYGI